MFWSNVTRLMERSAQAATRDADLPLLARATKAARYVSSLATAPLYLGRCTSCGRLPRTLGRPRVGNQGRISLGNDLILNSTFVPAELLAGPGAELIIGDGVAINFGTLVSARQRVKIGDHVSIGPYCVIADSDGTSADGKQVRPIVIEDGVWLAARVTVMPGATIGAKSVITAGSIVDGPIPPHVVAGGNPARPIRQVKSTKAGGVTREGVGAPVSAAPSSVRKESRPEKSAPDELRGVVLADSTLGELASRLAESDDDLVLRVATAPFGEIESFLLTPPPEGASDFAFIWTRPEWVSLAFQRVLRHETVASSEIEAEVDAFVSRIREGVAAYRFAFIASWILPAWQRGLGLIELQPGCGRTWALGVMNARLIERLAGTGLHVLDAASWMRRTDGAGPRGWYLGKVLHQGAVVEAAARDLKAAIRTLQGQSRKLVVLDLDDTLWGGIVGDVGWEHLRLGGHDAEGEAFAELQRSLKGLCGRGIVLGIVSKNEESVALEAIDRHPEMVLRRADFAGWRINWNDKAQNLVELAQELNLGLQSTVFIDDNPVERARVREALPEVLVPEWPEDKLLGPATLDALRCFDAHAITREDVARGREYVAERQREEVRRRAGDVDAWLEELGVRVRVEPLCGANLVRVVQLLNKTNQMNLATRRLTEPELEAWASAPGRAIWAVHVADRIGEAGLTGVVGLERRDSAAHVSDFVLSCRVFGRRIESVMLHLAVDWTRAQALGSLVAQYRPTPKNKPTLDFLRSSQLQETEQSVFVWDVAREYPIPRGVRLERAN